MSMNIKDEIINLTNILYYIIFTSQPNYFLYSEILPILLSECQHSILMLRLKKLYLIHQFNMFDRVRILEVWNRIDGVKCYTSRPSLYALPKSLYFKVHF